MKQWASLITLTILLTYTQMSTAVDGWTSVSMTEETRGEGDFLKLYAQPAVLMDGDTGRILYGKGQDIIRPAASTTRIIICILVLENGRREDTVKTLPNAASQPKMYLGVREGEECRLGDLLYALVLESYNDAAVTIAEYIGGSAEGLAAVTNEEVAGLSCGDTYFITPNRLDGVRTDEQGKEHIRSTIISDLARTMRYCVTKFPVRDEFLKITQTQNHYFTDTAEKRSFNYYNHSAFLIMTEGILFGKMGSTGRAGYSYVGAIESQGRTYAVVFLGCD